MNQIAKPATVPIGLSLSASVVRESTAIVPNLSATAETRLNRFIASNQPADAEEELAIERAIDATNEFVDLNGLPGAEYAPV
jgi:post-segregation antitoxin (ccd killing protein)